MLNIIKKNSIVFFLDKRIIYRKNIYTLLFTFYPDRVIGKDVKRCTYCCYVRCATLIVWVLENALAPNRRNSVPCTVSTSRQRSCNQRVVVCNNWDLEPLDLLNGLAPKFLSTIPWGINRIISCYLRTIMYENKAVGNINKKQWIFKVFYKIDIKAWKCWGKFQNQFLLRRVTIIYWLLFCCICNSNL